MGILQSVKQRERIPFLMTWVKENNAILVWLVIFLIASKEDISSHIWEHLSNTMNEDIGLIQTIFEFHVFIYLITNKPDKVI